MLEFNSSDGSNDDYQAIKPTEWEREGFVQKVYGILSLQLVITLLFCLFACTKTGTAFFQLHTGLAMFMMLLTIVCLIPLACCGNISRRVPLNYVLLLLFTTGEGYTVGFICAFYESTSVLIVIGITAAIVVGLTCYAVYSKADYTLMGGAMVALLLGLIVFGFVTAIFDVPFLRTLYCAMGAILFSFYIVIDTQLILGKGSARYSMDDYIMAAMNIYLDIINVFLYLLELFGNRE
eukprot:TRINITY_DN1832_c0_g1_i1.p1 TRINITY_DN1832_c0_g1~~TRINITY_DN1832_c0_g1_i1.p1  ORF type:complete len:236 (+),score=61.62 TRINITY_DN1832_c0_g1_i1:67-774(+)